MRGLVILCSIRNILEGNRAILKHYPNQSPHNNKRMSSNIEFLNSTLDVGFLSEFVEASVEKPADGRNGECTVHFSGHQGKYEMTVPLVNGMREGIGTILKEGAPFIQVEYHRGFASGTVCRMDDYGVVEMRGQLLNGMESGLFEEYDDNEKVVWRGYYRDGNRYSVDS